MKKHGEKDIPPFYISNKDRPAYLGIRFRIIVNSIMVVNAEKKMTHTPAKK